MSAPYSRHEITAMFAPTQSAFYQQKLADAYASIAALPVLKDGWSDWTKYAAIVPRTSRAAASLRVIRLIDAGLVQTQFSGNRGTRFRVVPRQDREETQ